MIQNNMKKTSLLMLYMLFMPAATLNVSGVFEIKIESELFNANFWVKVQDAFITIEQEAPSAPNLTLHTDLVTLGSIATGHISYKEAVAKNLLRLDGSEAEITSFLAHFEPT